MVNRDTVAVPRLLRPAHCGRASARRTLVLMLLSLLIIALQKADVAAENIDQKKTELKTTYLELYVSSSDPNHFSSVIERALRVSQRNLVPIAAIYHIGNYNNVTPEIIQKLQVAKLKIFALTEVPSDLPLASSPAWIFVTSSGRRIVEGTIAIDSFIDDSGEFRDGSNIRDPLAEATPEIIEKMEGF